MDYIIDYTFKDGGVGTATVHMPDDVDEKGYKKRMAVAISTMNKLNKSLKKQGATVKWRLEK